LETWWRLVHPNVTPLLGSIEDEELGDFGILISPVCVMDTHGNITEELQWAEMGNAATYIEMNLSYSQRINLVCPSPTIVYYPDSHAINDSSTMSARD
jgi:hypothetical protein